jgi:FkbM family methyltransferase
VHEFLNRTAYAVFRRVEFRGKGRIRRFAPVPGSGRKTVTITGGIRLELDLGEPLQRDYYFGMFDLFELGVVRRLLAARGGDFVDVGAYIGVYSLTAARTTNGRILAFEPHPGARVQLERNLRLNGAEAFVVPGAAGARAGEAALHMAAGGDPSWSTISDDGRFGAADTTVEVPITTVDAEAARHSLQPSVVKIDVEGRELDVLAGMEETLAAKPALLVEVSPASAATLELRLLDHGYRTFRIERSRLVEGAAAGRGIYNALFVSPDDVALVAGGGPRYLNAPRRSGVRPGSRTR